MTDTRRAYCDENAEAEKTSVSVKHLLKEFGEKSASTPSNDDDDDDDTFRSVRERLRIFDSRQDNNNDCDNYNNVSAPQSSNARESIGSTTTSITTTPTTPRKRFSHALSASQSNVPDSSTSTSTSVAYPPLTVSYLNGAEKRSSSKRSSSSSLKENSLIAKDVFKYGDVLLKKVEKPVEDRWKKNIANHNKSSSTKTEDEQMHRKGEEGIASGITSSSTTTTSSSRAFPFTNSSPGGNCRKPKSLGSGNHSQSFPSPTFATSVREEKHQNDLATALKKVRLPIEGRWKAMKKSEENASDSSKPVFATMRLRSVATGTPTNSNAESTLMKRRRMPTTAADMAQTSAVCYGEHNSKITFHNKGPLEEGIKVSDLAKTFSSQIKLASKGERAEEEKFIGRAASETNQIIHIRSTLKSSATELEELRKSLNSSTPVAKLIAERNKAAQANRSNTRNTFGSPEDSRTRKSYGLTRSKSVGRATASAADGHPHSSVRRPSSQQYRGNRDSDQARRESGNTLEGFSNLYWEDFKANNPTGGAGNIWDMNLDDSSSFGGQHGNSKSCTALDAIPGANNNKLMPSNSTISEYTTDSDAAYYYDHHGHSSYIQITLSSGGIVEKFEPVICMSTTDDSSTEYQSEYGVDTSIDPTTSDSRHSTRKALKGAKNFFFGKNKRKNGPVEV